ncbi:MAG: CHAT domain-containing protein [Bacteroidota bacterium]
MKLFLKKIKISYSKWAFSALLNGAIGLCLLLPFGLLGQLEQQADSLSDMGAYEVANKLYIRLQEGERDVIKSFELNLKIAINEQRQNQDEKASERIKKLIAENEQKDIPDSLFGLAHHKLGVSAYSLQNYAAAIEHYQQAIRIRSNSFPETHPDIVKAYRNIAGCYEKLSKLDQALVVYEKIIELSEKNSALLQTYLTLAHLRKGGILAKKGAIQEADYYIKAGVNLVEQYANEDFYALSDAYNQAFLYQYELKNGTQMIHYAQKSLNLYLSLEESELYEEDYYEIANAHNNLAIGYEFQQAYEQAISHYQKAIAINVKHKDIRLPYLADNYNNLADLYREKEQFSLALAHIQQAIKYEKEAGVPQELAIEYYNRGEIYFEQKKYEQALLDYQKALELYVLDFEDNAKYNNPSTNSQQRGDKLSLVEILADKAAILYHFGVEKQSESLLKTALATYDTTAVFIDQIRISFQSDASKNFLATEAKSIYEDAVRAALKLYQTTKKIYFKERAFEYAERSKALVLLEAVKENNAKQRMGIDADWLTKEKDLKQQIAHLEQALFESKEAEAKANAIRLEIIDLQQQLAYLIEELEATNPSYYQLKYEVQLPQISAIQQTLTAEEAILEYLVGEENIYWFFIQAGDFKSGSIALNFPLKQWIEDVRFSISSKNKNTLNQDSLARVYADLGYRLYEAIIVPISIQVKDIQSLRIIPDGILGYLPFDALLTEKINKNLIGNYASYPFLHHNFQISYNYSIALSQEMERIQHTPKHKQILAFAPIFKSRRAAKLGTKDISLPPLLSNVRATKDLLQIYKGKGYLKEAASKLNFLSEAKDYAYLHLASHAQMNDENANYSFISFSQLGDSINKDQLLFVNELYNMKLNADMVVLSACETGIGELKEGEGIISLARAFSYAGAKSIITSLWQVDDQKTGDLMLDYYRHLKKNSSKNKALHQAKQSMIESGFQAHPYYWAGFIAIGDIRQLEERNNTIWMFGLSGLLLSALFLFFWKRRRGN